MTAIYEQIAWYDPKETPLPKGMCSVLIYAHGIVWSGVWSSGNEKVIVYPEDYSPMTVDEIKLWAKFPKARP